MRNTFGNLFTLTTFGESHGIAVGGVIDGFPAGIDIDMDFIQSELNRRRPGQSHITTARKEADQVEFLSGVFEGKSTGTPIGFEVRNQNQHSQDYENMRCLFRPSHADFTYNEKYGIRDHRGGGRSSARITIARCVGGALAKLALRQLGVSITAYTSQVGSIALEKDYHLYDLNTIEDNPVRCPDQTKAKEMEEKFKKASFDFNDFLDQMEQMEKMGGMNDILKMLPGFGNKKQLQNLEIDDNAMNMPKAIILSMTKQERSHPEIINPSRKKRIADGAGVPISEVNKLIKQFEQSRKMMKQMSGMMGGKRRGGFKLPFGF